MDQEIPHFLFSVDVRGRSRNRKEPLLHSLTSLIPPTGSTAPRRKPCVWHRHSPFAIAMILSQMRPSGCLISQPNMLGICIYFRIYCNTKSTCNTYCNLTTIGNQNFDIFIDPFSFFVQSWEQGIAYTILYQTQRRNVAVNIGIG